MPDKPEQSLAGRLLKAAGAAGLLAYAAFALLSGTDRQSRDFPSSPSMVGWPYDTGAARAKATLAFVRTGPASAVNLASRSILSDPISAQAISMLGRAQLYSGQLAQAHRTFEVVGQLGWRDAMTQIYWLDQAIQGNDFKVASERLDALLRQDPDDENRDRFLAVLAASPEGRAALAERLRLSPGWAPRFLTDTRDLPADQMRQRVDIVRRIGPGLWNCAATQYLTENLIKSGMLDEAQSIWRQNCGSSNALVYDGSFEQLDTTRPSAGFNWQLSSRSDIDIAVRRDATGKQLLSMQVGAAVTVPVLRQLIVLPPGRYRLTWRTPETSAMQARALHASLGCKLDFAQALAGSPDPAKPGIMAQSFEVGSQCPAQTLAFWLEPNTPVQLDDVALQPE